jgi:hypothetical protein
VSHKAMSSHMFGNEWPILSRIVAIPRKGGRRPLDPNDPRVQMSKTMHRDKHMAIGDICKTLGISRSTFYRYLALSE